MNQEPVIHTTFVIQRTYPASIARVFQALSDREAKAKWFAGESDWTAEVREMEFRIGGRERVRGRWQNGTITEFVALYHDIVAERRIVYAYDMYVNEKRISVSLATFELAVDGKGTRLELTEQGAYFDGDESPSMRERGTNFLMDRLGASLTP